MNPKPSLPQLELRTSSEWNDDFWTQILPIYEASFPKHIRKPERIVRNMLTGMDAFLHIGIINGSPCSMALTGLSSDKRLLIIDYLAVSPTSRKHGIGKQMVTALADWARKYYQVSGLLIEAEDDESPEGQNRLRFWQNCGFEPTTYIHSYIWIPEKYRAMILDLQPETERHPHPLSRNGQELFKYIETFHKSSFKA